MRAIIASIPSSSDSGFATCSLGMLLEHGKTSSDRELVAEILGLSALSVGASKAVLGGLAVLGCDL